MLQIKSKKYLILNFSLQLSSIFITLALTPLISEKYNSEVFSDYIIYYTLFNSILNFRTYSHHLNYINLNLLVFIGVFYVIFIFLDFLTIYISILILGIFCIYLESILINRNLSVFIGAFFSSINIYFVVSFYFFGTNDFVVSINLIAFLLLVFLYKKKYLVRKKFNLNIKPSVFAFYNNFINNGDKFLLVYFFDNAIVNTFYLYLLLPIRTQTFYHTISTFTFSNIKNREEFNLKKLFYISFIFSFLFGCSLIFFIEFYKMYFNLSDDFLILISLLIPFLLIFPSFVYPYLVAQKKELEFSFINIILCMLYFVSIFVISKISINQSLILFYVLISFISFKIFESFFSYCYIRRFD